MEYRSVTPDNVINIENLITVHYFEYARDYSFCGEKHDFWELVYIDRGEVGILAENKGYVLKRGEAVFHKPMEYHNIWAHNGFANSVIITFSASGGGMDFFKNRILRFDDEDKLILSGILKEAKKYFNEPLNIVELSAMTKKRGAPFGGEQLIRLYLTELLINLVRKHTEKTNMPSSSQKTAEEGKQKIVDSVILYLQEHIPYPVTLDDIVSDICFSKTYIKSLFKAKTGTTIIKYLTTLRIDAAKRLISDGGMNFSEIAAKCGFSTVHYFSNTFKKYTGMTPTEYSVSVKAKGIL